MKKIIKNVGLALTVIMFKIFAFATEHINIPEGPLVSHPKYIYFEILKHIGSDDIKNIIFVNKMFKSAMQNKELWFIYCQNAKFSSLSSTYDQTQDYDAQYKFFADPSFTMFQTQQTTKRIISAVSADARTLVAQFYGAPLSENKKLSIESLGYSEVCVANCPYNENYSLTMTQNHVLHLLRFKPIIDNHSMIHDRVAFQYVKLSEDGSIITGQLLNFDKNLSKQPCTLTGDSKSGNYDLKHLDHNTFNNIESEIEARKNLIKEQCKHGENLAELNFNPLLASHDGKVFSGRIEFNGLKVPQIFIIDQEDFTLESYLREHGILGDNIRLKSIDAITPNGVSIVGKAYDSDRKQNFTYRATIPTRRNKF